MPYVPHVERIAGSYVGQREACPCASGFDRALKHDPRRADISLAEQCAGARDQPCRLLAFLRFRGLRLRRCDGLDQKRRFADTAKLGFRVGLYRRLFVRRARLNLRHTGDTGIFALSFDGGQNSVTVKDAYVDWSIVRGRGQRQGLVLRAGQFFRTFGFELERGESVREFLERPVAWDILFPGNRDQGFDLSLGLTPAVTVNAAVLNGGGTSTANLSFRDADNRKDVLARLRYSLFSPRADLALSFYDGEQTIAGVPAVAATRGFADANNNGRQDAGEDTVVVAPAKAAVPAIRGARDRWGIALNLYNVVGGTVRGEWIEAQDLTTNLASTGARMRVAHARTWFAQYTHALPKDVMLGARYDIFDPDTKDAVRLGGDGEQRTLGVAVSRRFGEYAILTLLWEHQTIDTYKKLSRKTDRSTNDPLTFQVQYAF